MRRMRRMSPRSRRSEVMTFETKNIGGETPEQLSASPRLFESDLLDKLSRVHHLTPVIIYTPIILGLTIYSLTLQGAATVALGLFVGYIAWTLTEYFGHRYLFHTVFALPLRARAALPVSDPRRASHLPERPAAPRDAAAVVGADHADRARRHPPAVRRRHSAGRCWRDSSAAM